MIAILAFGNKDIMANDMRVHLFRVRTMDGAEPLADLLTRIKADALDARLRKIGYHEMRLESVAQCRFVWNLTSDTIAADARRRTIMARSRVKDGRRAARSGVA
ncbi:MAG: hypothetical protein ACREWI_13385, partial [Telluria sp.]